MHIPHRIGAGLLAGSLFLGGVAGVLAAPAHQGARLKQRVGFAAGQVSNLSASGFTLTRTGKKAQAGTTATKTVQVTIGAATKDVARKGTTGALANGEYALVVGTKTAAGITARRVLYSATSFKAGRIILRQRARRILQRLQLHRAAGSVTLSSSNSITIQTKKGKTLLFVITAKTHFRVNGQPVQAAPAFTAGERVIVRYRKAAKNAAAASATPSLVASAIIVRPAKTATP